MLCFFFCLFAFTSDYTLRVSLSYDVLGSLACVFECVCVSVRPRVRICGSAPWKRLVLSLSLCLLLLPFPFSVSTSAFSATTRCTVQSVSLTKHDQDNKKKIINANLPNSAFVSVRGSVLYGLLFCFCLCYCCKRYSTHVIFSLLHCLNGPYFSFFLFCFIKCEFFFSLLF